jgi:nitric oxide-associated protein 1
MLYQKDTSSLAVIMVDLLDFPCSIFPNLAEVLGKNRPIFVVGNKVDLLPRDSSSFLDHLKQCLKLEAMKMGFEEHSIRHVTLVSAKTGYGVEELITKLYTNWKYRGNVYLIGCTNVGKSSLFNRLIKSDYCKSDASNLIKRATASVWPGTTIKLLKFPILRPSDYRLYLRGRRIMEEKKLQVLTESERREQAIKHKRIEDATLIGHIGRTFETKEYFNDPGALNQESGFSGNKYLEVFDETKKEYDMSKWCYDTPGVMHSDQILPFLTTDEIIKVLPRQMMQARMLYVKSGMSLFIAGLARLDIIEVPPLTRLIVYASLDLPLTIVNTVDAEEFYENFLGSEILGVPMDLGENRLKNWPKLESTYNEIVVEGVDKHISTCDFVMSSAGWIGANLPREKTGKFRPYTLGGRGIHVRNPSILPNGWVLRGQRVRDSPAYTLGKAFSYRKLLRREPRMKNK